jgi:hypothetical protein
LLHSSVAARMMSYYGRRQQLVMPGTCESTHQVAALPRAVSDVMLSALRVIRGAARRALVPVVRALGQALSKRQVLVRRRGKRIDDELGRALRRVLFVALARDWVKLRPDRVRLKDP